MKHLRLTPEIPQQMVAAIALTSLLSVGTSIILADAVAAKPVNSTQGMTNLKQSRAKQLPNSVVNAIRRDIARRSRTARGQWRVVSYNQQSWPNSCLGLSKPDEMCGQVFIENGWRVVMSNGSQTVTYRTDATGRIVRLEQEAISPNPDSRNLPSSVTQAVLRATAQRTGLPLSQLRIAQAERRTWPNGCLGLEVRDMGCTLAIVPGWQVAVEGPQQRWVYRTNDSGSQVMLEDSTGNTGDRNLPNRVMNAVLQAASQRTGLRTSQLRIVESETMTTDGCLNLPRPGEACIEIALQAWEVTVEGQNQRLVYRASEDGTQVRFNEKASIIGGINQPNPDMPLPNPGIPIPNFDLPRPAADAVLRAVSQRSGLSPANLRIVKAQPIKTDGSCLGLPRPGEGCTRDLRLIWQVTVEGQNQRWVYHAAPDGSQVRLNESMAESGSTQLPDTVSRSVLYDASKQLNLPVSRLRIVESEPRNWSDGCLGLAKPGMLCTQATVSGWQVAVAGEGQNLVYRTNESGNLVMLENPIPGGKDIGVPIPGNEAASPLPNNAIFRVITSGGFTGRTQETMLLNNGQMIKRVIAPNGVGSSPEIIRVSPERLEQFKQLLSRQPIAQYDGLNYSAPRGAADYITVTVTSQDGTIRFVDMAQNQLPKSVQMVMQTWNLLTREGILRGQ